MTADLFLSKYAERQMRLVADPEAVTADRYREMLEVLPPARWIRGPNGAFLVGEAMSHDDNGQANLTIAEFEAKHDEPITGHGRGQE